MQVKNQSASFHEQIVEHHFALHISAIHILFKSVGSNESLMKRFTRLGRCSEDFGTLPQASIILFGDFELTLREFHFAYIYRLVAAVDEQVDLRPFSFPTTDITLNPGNA